MTLHQDPLNVVVFDDVELQQSLMLAEVMQQKGVYTIKWPITQTNQLIN